MAKEQVERLKRFIISETSSGGECGSIMAHTKEEALEEYLNQCGNSISAEKCPQCGEELHYAMIDTDGTNLEEGMECPNPDCDYERIGVE